MATVDSLHLPAGAFADTTGEWAVWHDFNKSNEQALHKAELLSGLPTIILLFVAFGSAIAAGLPLVLAVAGIAVGFAVLHLATGVTPLSVWSMNFSMMIGLAVGIDYSLFIVSRYREEREDGKEPARCRWRDPRHRRQGRVPVGVDRRPLLGGHLPGARSWCSGPWPSA